jgi:hypothetical protein
MFEGQFGFNNNNNNRFILTAKDGSVVRKTTTSINP